MSTIPQKYSYDELNAMPTPELKKLCTSREFHFWPQNAERADSILAERAAKAAPVAPSERVLWKRLKNFMESHPQLKKCSENSETITHWMEENSADLDYSLNDLTRMWDALAPRGFLILLPAEVGIEGMSAEISGSEVVRLRSTVFHKLTQPFREETPESREARMSAKEYLAAHPELHDNRVSPLIQRRIDQAIAFFIEQNPGYVIAPENQAKILTWLEKKGLPINVSTLRACFEELSKSADPQERIVIDYSDRTPSAASITRLTDLGSPRNVPPPVPDAYPLRKKIDSMTADEYSDRYRKDPKFRAEVDSL
jgi:hypothetical protein